MCGILSNYEIPDKYVKQLDAVVIVEGESYKQTASGLRLVFYRDVFTLSCVLS